MASLVSPGVLVTVVDESFFIPSSATTVPLFFIATVDEKLQPDNISLAAGTFESNIVRTVTSLKQSTELYGIPRFLEDINGNPHHGDARNEYGLFALNQFLGIGNLSFVIRANVNLNDNFDDLQASWQAKMTTAGQVVRETAQTFLDEYNAANGFIPLSPGFRETVTDVEFLNFATDVLNDLVFSKFSFRNLDDDVLDDHTLAPFDVFANGYNVPATGTFIGLAGIIADWVANTLGGTVPTEFTPIEAEQILTVGAGPFNGVRDDFQFTVQFLNQTSLGADDTARRLAIVQALQASVNSNTDIRSENFEFNLVLCPGYFEVVDELINLSVDLQDEVHVIADTPFFMNPDEVANWAVTINRRTSINAAYYYPHGIASNLDGKDVFVAASGIALRTYTFSDLVAELWFAPAGTRRGIVSSVSLIGYVSGTLGGPTTFNFTPLNQGQRDNLYNYFKMINPITFFPGRGIVVWGQKNAAANASAFDRVNVSRLIKYIKRSLRKNTLSFVFEPNDQITRDNLKAIVDSFLVDLVVKRGLFDFATVSDESNNTPDRIDRNEMYIDVALKPIRAAEFLLIPIRVVSTGAQI